MCRVQHVLVDLLSANSSAGFIIKRHTDPDHLNNESKVFMKDPIVLEFILARLEFQNHEKQIILYFKCCRKLVHGKC